MLDGLVACLHKHASGRRILLLFGLVVLWNVFVMSALVGTILPIDLRLFYSAETVYAVVESIVANDGLERTIALYLTIDTVYPLLYAVLLASAITWSLHRTFAIGRRVHRLALLPFGAAVFDWLENLGMVGVLAAYPARLDTLANAVSVCTALKWFTVGLSLLILFMALTRAATHRPRATQGDGAQRG